MGQYVAGWDGGGTKTAIQIRDLDGNVIKESKAGALNYNSLSRPDICKTINSLIEIMASLPGGLNECKSLCIATAGISNKEAVSFIKMYVKTHGIVCDTVVVSDYEAALYGAFRKPDGIVLISGTGSICYGKNIEGYSYRTGGFGHLIDDEGSGYAIGRDILGAAVRIYDKRIHDSILYDLVLEQIGGNTVEDIIEYTYQYNWSKSTIAELSTILLKALEMGDTVAKRICQKASEELVNLVLPVVKHLCLEENKITLLGGILEHYEAIRNQVIQIISQELPLLKVIKPQSDSVTGAANIALEHYYNKKLVEK